MQPILRTPAVIQLNHWQFVIKSTENSMGEWSQGALENKYLLDSIQKYIPYLQNWLKMLWILYVLEAQGSIFSLLIKLHTSKWCQVRLSVESKGQVWHNYKNIWWKSYLYEINDIIRVGQSLFVTTQPSFWISSMLIIAKKIAKNSNFNQYSFSSAFWHS